MKLTEAKVRRRTAGRVGEVVDARGDKKCRKGHSRARLSSLALVVSRVTNWSTDWGSGPAPLGQYALPSDRGTYGGKGGERETSAEENMLRRGETCERKL